MNFKLSIDKWNLVSEKGLPEDGTWCFVVWKTHDGKYDWTVGGYDEKEKKFYANFGLGGMVMKEEHVVAWAVFGEDETFTTE